MQLTFIFPNALWLLLLAPLVWALTFAVPRRVARWRFWFSLLTRTIVLVALVLSLAGAQLVQPRGATTTVFLLDGSDSVSLSQRARAEAFIQQALATMPVDDQAGIVVFGQQAQVERAPSNERGFGQVISQPGGSATNLQSAMDLGLSMLPNEGHQRIVLLSDGGENTGTAEAAMRIATSRGIPVDVVPLNGLADGLDAQVAGVSLPASARAGQALRMQITLDSNTPTTATLLVQGPDGQLIAAQPVELVGGAQTFDLTLPEPQPFFNRYVVRLRTENDARPENNAAEAFTFVGGQPRVLLVEGEPGEAVNLAGALAAAKIDVTVVSPQSMPDSLSALSAYDATVLMNVPKHAISDQRQSLLNAYVHDIGRGLLMVGGPQSFGAGGWRETPIEQALPVSMDIPTQFQLPPVSIVVLIDVSGSMAQEEGGRTKIELAAEGAARIAALMRDSDELTVIPFDSEAQGVVGPLPGSRRDEAIDALGRIAPGGGGINIHDGLVKAEQYINQSKNPVRHIITITDGNDTVQQEGALEIVKRLRQNKVTLTSIAIGEGKDVPFIRGAVSAGGGRMFLTERAAEIPSILTNEAQAVIQPYIVEEPFTPIQTATHPILRGVEETPALAGYVVTTPKQTAQVLLTTQRGEPLLAAWQYGLGHALAWTSDLRGQWGKEWVAWDQYPRFAAQLVSWLLPTQNTQNLTLQASTIGAQLILSAEAQDTQGRPASGLRVAGRMLSGDGAIVEVELREVGPGKYRAPVNDARPGAYLVQLIAQDASGQAFGAVTAGAVVPQSAEYRTQGANPGLLEAIAKQTGGRVNIEPKAAFEPNRLSRGAVREISLPLLVLVLLLLPLDIASRRLLFGRDQVAAAFRRVRLNHLADAIERGRQVAPQEPPTLPRPVPVAHAPIGTQQIMSRDKPPKPRASAKKEADLERLREAQERARRRARGEED
jgi:uncharacterized membrane protein